MFRHDQNEKNELTSRNRQTDGRTDTEPMLYAVHCGRDLRNETITMSAVQRTKTKFALFEDEICLGATDGLGRQLRYGTFWQRPSIGEFTRSLAMSNE